MDARVVTDLQHIEVASLRAAADAVDARDVGTLALHGEQRPHHLLVAVVLEVGRARRQRPRTGQQQQGWDPGHGVPRLLHRHTKVT